MSALFVIVRVPENPSEIATADGLSRRQGGVLGIVFN